MNNQTIIILFVLAALAAAGYFGFKYWFKSGTETTGDQRKTEVYTNEQEDKIIQVMASSPYNREEAIQLLVANGLLSKSI
jgi:flagellar basal body-associated protein FliL